MTPLPLLTTNSGSIPATASVGADAARNVLVGWFEYDRNSGVSGQLVIASRTTGAADWSVRPVPLEQFHEPACLVLRMAMDAAGNAWLYGNTGNALYLRATATGVWRRKTLTSDILPESALHGNLTFWQARRAIRLRCSVTNTPAPVCGLKLS